MPGDPLARQDDECVKLGKTVYFTARKLGCGKILPAAPLPVPVDCPVLHVCIGMIRRENSILFLACATSSS